MFSVFPFPATRPIMTRNNIHMACRRQRKLQPRMLIQGFVISSCSGPFLLFAITLHGDTSAAATSLCVYGRLSSIIRALCSREVFVVRAIGNILRDRRLAHALPDGKLIPIPRLGHPVATRYHVSILAMPSFGSPPLRQEILRCLWLYVGTGKHTHGDV